MSLKGPDSRQEEILWKALSLLALLFIIAVGVGIGWVALQILQMLEDILIPVAIAAIVAYLLHPLVNLLERLRLPRGVAVLVLFALVGGGLAATSVVVAPQLYRQSKLLAQSLPGWETRIEEKIDAFLEDNTSLSGPLNNVTQVANTHLKQAATDLVTLTGLGKLLHTVGFAFGMVFIPFYLFYFLADQPQIERSWKDYIPLHDSTVKREIVIVVEQINKYLVSFFRGQVIVAFIDGIMIMIGLALIGVDLRASDRRGGLRPDDHPLFRHPRDLPPRLPRRRVPGGGRPPPRRPFAGGLRGGPDDRKHPHLPPGDEPADRLHPVTVLVSILIWSSF